MTKQNKSSDVPSPKKTKPKPRKIVRDPVTHRRLHLPKLVR